MSADYYAYDAGLPCKNPNCHSHGSPHPNCRCYSGYAKGGSVCSEGKPHLKDCVYFASGGPAEQPPVESPPDDVPNTLGMASVHQGLLGLLKNTGHAKLPDEDKHVKKIHDLKHAKDKPSSLHEHPLASGVSKKNLSPILERLHGPMESSEASPHGLKTAIDYLHSSIQGQNKLKADFEHLLSSKKNEREGSPEKREALKAHLQHLDENPEDMLKVGGSLGHYLPEHSSLLAAQSATAVNYLNSLKPKTQQLAPLDSPAQPDKQAEAIYDRQLDVSEDPLLILSHVKQGTLQPQDLKTVQTIYPGLFKSMVNQAGELLIEAKTRGTEIPYQQRLSMSLLLGQPLDFTQTSEAAHAIMQSQSQAPKTPGTPKSGKSGATAAELKQINKVDEMSETTLEARQINRNAR